MDNKDYLDFDEAVQFLKTTPSTLYKWLQAGKVPGHKLGRQWRFLKDELELHVSGKAPKIQLQKEILQLAEFLEKRAQKNSKEGMMNLLNDLSEKLIWDAYDHGIREIHISPTSGKYEIIYRVNRDACEQQTCIEEELFKILDKSWTEQSSAVKVENSRRLHLHRGDEDALQVRYHKVETISGPHILLSLFQPAKDIMSMDQLGFDKKQQGTLHSWFENTRGLLIVSGPSGSGKTSSVYSFLNEMKKKNRVVFTLEDSAILIMNGINQVEYASRDKGDFEKNLMAICSSNPDVIGMGLGASYGMEELVLRSAASVAKDNLVILQMDAASTKEAIEKIEKVTGAPLGFLLKGCLWQNLVKADSGKMKAHYEFFS